MSVSDQEVEQELEATHHQVISGLPFIIVALEPHEILPFCPVAHLA